MHELCSAMPHWEAIKSLLSFLVTDGIETENDEELEVGIFDISRAHFMPKVKRELYIELPPEDMKPGEEDMVGRQSQHVRLQRCEFRMAGRLARFVKE